MDLGNLGAKVTEKQKLSIRDEDSKLKSRLEVSDKTHPASFCLQQNRLLQKHKPKGSQQESDRIQTQQPAL